MEPIADGAVDKCEEIKSKLRQCFDGKIVRKDLTKKIKEGANVPVYVLEFLLGQYCSSDDDTVIEQGVQNVKKILSENFVRPDEAQKVLSRLRKKGSYTVIDMVTARLDMKRNLYVASFSNLGITNVLLEDEYPEKYDRLLCGGIWCIVQLDYEYVEEEKKNGMPVQIRKLTPIQMPHVEIEELKEGRKQFTEDEWLDVMMRSIGMEPDQLSEREKWLLLLHMVPLVENNFNLCELGPRSTGKSHLYKEISPNSILSTYNESIDNAAESIAAIIRRREKLTVPDFRIEKETIQIQTERVHDYEFNSRLGITEIDEEYVKGLFASEMKKGTKKSVLEMSQDELSERLSYFTGAPSEALNELKTKIQEKVNDDLANKFTITQAGKDRTQELSSGLDAQISFLPQKRHSGLWGSQYMGCTAGISQ